MRMSMKKLLVLTFVLALATTANAMNLQISVNGEPNPSDSEIWVFPSDLLILDIHNTETYEFGDDTAFVLVCNPALASISGGVVLPGAPTDSFIEDDAVGNGFWPGPENGICGYIFSFDLQQTFDPGVYIDEILFHCEALGDVVVNLLTSQDFVVWTLADSVAVHQIPEPATVCLLGLGTLLFRKRKNKNQI